MDQNGLKENMKNSPPTRPRTTPSGNSVASGMALKIPKQPLKSAGPVKKARQPKSRRDGAPDTPNQPRPSRETRRNEEEPEEHKKADEPHCSTSPTRRKDNGDASEDVKPNNVQPEAPVDVESTSQSLKQLLSIGEESSSRIVYSRIQLLNIAENPSCKSRPECLGDDFNATNGRWDPETWHRSLEPPNERKPPTIDNKDSFADDTSTNGIILGPQRRSFQDGCHVTNSSTSRLSKHHLTSPTESSRLTGARPRLVIRQRSEVADYEGPAPGRERQIESASALRTEDFDWERPKGRFERDLTDLRPEPRSRGPRELPKSLHELRTEYARERESDPRDRKYSQSRDFGARYPPQQRRDRRFSNNEPEPEWFTDGPTSRTDTIDLTGFTEDTPVAAADFSSWGGEIPMDDLDLPDKGNGKEKEETKEETEEEKSETEKTEEVEKVDVAEETNRSETPDISAAMDEILRESENADEVSSRFSRWFKKDNEGSSSPNELENVAELAAERGLASPTDVGGKTQTDVLRFLTQMKEEESAVLKAEQREILKQQMELGSVMSVADIEANVGARQPYRGGVDVQNTDAFNKLVSSLREKDKMRHQLMAQQAILQGKANAGPESGQNPFQQQQVLIKKQLDRQKEAYKEKVRMMEQQRHEEKLREVLRSVDAKLLESKQTNKSLAFMPTSVMRNMQESREGKREEMMGESDDLASATASFSARLANSGKKSPHDQNNELLARIYQSASQAKRNDPGGLRRNASYPEVLMDANKIGGTFQPLSRQHVGTSNLDLSQLHGDMDLSRLRLLELQNRQQAMSGAGRMQKGGSKSERFHESEAELKNQHEVAVLTQSVLKQIGITEEQLSRLNSQQQQAVVRIVQNQFYELQARKQQADKKAQMMQNEKQMSERLQKQAGALAPNSVGVKFASNAGIPGVTAPGPIPGLLPSSNPQLHPYQLRVAPPLSFISPMARAPVVPATFLPHQPHLPGRILPPNVPLANQAAAFMQMQLLQQQQQQRLYAAAFQQQQQLQAQLQAAARQQNAKDGREFSNPLERWFGRDVLSQSQLPPQKPPMSDPNKEG